MALPEELSMMHDHLNIDKMVLKKICDQIAGYLNFSSRGSSFPVFNNTEDFGLYFV